MLTKCPGPKDGVLAVAAHPRAGLPCGDYAVLVDGKLIAAVERKSVPDLVASLIGGRLRYGLGELATLPPRRSRRGGPVLQDLRPRASTAGARRRRPGRAAGPLAHHPDAFCETRKLTEKWTYRYLAAADSRAAERPALERIGMGEHGAARAPPQPAPSTAELRAWARGQASRSPIAVGCAVRSTRHGRTPSGMTVRALSLDT